MNEEEANDGKGTQYFECEGYGYFRAECLTFMKYQKKRLFVAWPESDDESKGEGSNKVKDFTGKYDSSSESDEEVLTEGKLAESFRILLTKWKESCLREKTLKNTLRSLLL